MSGHQDVMQGKLAAFREDAGRCRRCADANLLCTSSDGLIAPPLFQRNPSAALGVLVVGEAPNYTDTYDPKKGHLTYSPDTDETGKFMTELLTREVGLREEEVSDILFTNAVLCLPARKDERHPVTARQLDLCGDWLLRLIDDTNTEIVVALGATPLAALHRLHPHGLTLRDAVGRLHPWYRRSLLPLYHPGRLGRANRPAELQRRDILPLRDYISARRGTRS